MASDSAPSTAEYVTDTSGSSVQIVAPVVDLTGEAIVSSGGPPSHASAHSAPIVSVRSSCGRGQDSLQAASIHDAISVQSSQISSAHGQSLSDDEETAQARMDAALAAQEMANQRLACIRAKKRSSRSSRASSIAEAMSPPLGLLGSLPPVLEPIPAPLLPEEVPGPQHRRDAHHAPRDAPGSSDFVHTELPIREPTRTGPLQMLSSMFGGGDRQSTETTRPLEHQPLQWHDTELDAASQQAALADLGIIQDKLEKNQDERRDMAQKIVLFNMDKPPRKSNSSYGTPEDLIESPMEVTQKKKLQLFSMTPCPLHPDTVNDDWEMNTEGLTEKEVNLRCFKLLDRNLELQHRREPDGPPKKDDGDYNGMNEREINLRLLKALEKNNKIAKHGPPGSSPPSSTSSSSGDSDNYPDRVKKKAKKAKKDHLKTHLKSARDKDLKLPPLPEATDLTTCERTRSTTRS